MSTGNITLNRAPAYRFVVLAIGILVYMQTYMSLQLSSTYGAFIQMQGHLSVTQLGILYSACILGIAITSIFTGSVSAKIGGKNTIILGLAIQVIIALSFTVVSSNYSSLMVLRFLQGVSGGLLQGTILGLAAVWFPASERGMALGFLQGFFGIALSIMTFLGPLTTNAGLSWQVGGAAILGVSGVAMAIIFFLFFKEVQVAYPGVGIIDELLPQAETAQAASDVSDNSVKPKNFGEAFRLPRFWLMMGSTFCNCFTSFGLAFVIPLLLSVQMKLSAAQTTALLGATFFSTLIASPLGGWLSDKLFKSKRSPVVIIGYALTLICLLIIPKTPIAIIGVVLFICFGAPPLMNGPFWCLPAEEFDPSFIIKVTGFLTFVTFIGGVIGGALLGYMADVTHSVFAPLYFLVGIVTVGLLCGIGIKK
ncbi:MAG: MFS transporter [Syntrophomonas sp.]